MQNENYSALKNPMRYKFLRRTIQINTDGYESALKLAKYTRARRLYFRKIFEDYLSKSKTRHSYLKGKQLNCLAMLEFTLCLNSRDREYLKHLKNLRHMKIRRNFESPTKSLAAFIKTLPKNVEIITIFAPIITVNAGDIPTLYQNLSICRNLKKLQMSLIYQKVDEANVQEGESLCEVEYTSINKYLKRLRSLRELSSTVSEDEKQGFQKFMSQNQACPYVTSIAFPCFQSSIPESGLGSIIAPMFRFYLFSNLKELRIFAYASNLLYINPSIAQGFKSLFQLQKLSLDIAKQIEGIKFIFEGLLELPQLSSFHMLVDSFESDEAPQLVEFIREQSQLVSLSIKIRGSLLSREKCKEYNYLPDIICQSLNDKVKLKYLCLNATNWSLESLSRGLKKAAKTNQLKELEIDIFDDFSGTSLTPHDRVEGLCDFIQRQKLSLRSLKMSLSCVKDDEIIDSILKAISETDKLESLEITLNSSNTPNSFNNIEFLKDIPEEPLLECPSFKKTLFYLDKALIGMTELSDLTLSLEPLIKPFKNPVDSTSKVLPILLDRRNLRSLSLSLPFIKEEKTVLPSKLAGQQKYFRQNLRF